jgi:hydrogenase expression/formation protein HypE
MNDDGPRILLAHGGGGMMMRELLAKSLLPRLGNPFLERLEDAAVLAAPKERIAFTTDAFVVKPLFFRGGDIGRLAVCGTVNDLAAMGARPLALSLAMIVEEGLPVSTLEKVLDSLAATAKEANVQVVAGDTKVVERGAADGLYLITAGIGAVPEGAELGADKVRPGDAVLVTGTIGDHGIAIVSERSGLEFETQVESDVAPLADLVGRLMASHARAVRCMRDPTRGGTAAVLNEIAEAAVVRIEIDEKSVPVRREVAGACDMLGFDPLYVPNEGRMVIFCDPDAADEIVARLREHPLGKDAVRIGRVVESPTPRVILRTRIGGSRILTLPYGEQLPRIC